MAIRYAGSRKAGSRGVPASLQQRACTLPIWYQPRKKVEGCSVELATDKEVTTMPDAVSRVMKINIRTRSKERINTLLRDILGGEPDRIAAPTPLAISKALC